MNEAMIASRIEEETTLALCAASVSCGGETFEPDVTKGFMEFRLSHSLPVVTTYGTALHPGTIFNSWSSMRNQLVNLAHMMRAYEGASHGNGGFRVSDC